MAFIKLIQRSLFDSCDFGIHFKCFKVDTTGKGFRCQGLQNFL